MPEYPESPLRDRNYFCDKHFTEDAAQRLAPASEQQLAKRCGLRSIRSPDTQRDEDILQLIDPTILSSSLEMWSTGQYGRDFPFVWPGMWTFTTLFYGGNKLMSRVQALYISMQSYIYFKAL